MDNVILGNSISAYTIAACLDYFHEDFVIYSNCDASDMPPIMLLKYSNEKELATYGKLFGIDNIRDFTKTIKIGYLYDGIVHDDITDEIQLYYLLKQGRELTKSSLSDKLSSFNAIKLNEIYDELKRKYSDRVCLNGISNKFIEQLKKESNVYDTITPVYNNYRGKYEYVTNTCYQDLLDYDYIYDCNPGSPVKRFSKNCTEYIKCPEQPYKQIVNYYNPHTVYIEKSDFEYIRIGRSATKTQTKQEDIIKYMFDKLGGKI